MTDPLAALRDVHLPPEPGWWPPAPIYGLVAIALAILAADLAWRWYRRRLAPTLTAAAHAEMRRIRREFAAHADPRALARELGALLRRVAIARSGAPVAGLAGAAWAAYLAQAAPPDCDPRLWDAVAFGRYARGAPAADADALLRQCARWLGHVCP